MRDQLVDLLEHTHNLGCVDLIKIEGTEEETTFTGLADDRSVVIQGKFHDPIPEFVGTFGMPNMSNLKTILSLEPYKKDAIISVKNDKEKGPVSMNFKEGGGDFQNDFRFMVKEVVEDKLKPVKFKGANWDVEFEPAVASIQRLKYQSAACPDELTFTMKTVDNQLKIYLGDHSSHSGEFIFQHDVSGDIIDKWHWPIEHSINILSLAGDKSMKVSNDGATQITVDSGLGEYVFILPAQSK